MATVAHHQALAVLVALIGELLDGGSDLGTQRRKSAHPAALAAIKDIYNAEDIDRVRAAVTAFEVDYGAKYPKAVAKIVDDLDTLVEFSKYPAEH